MIEYVSNLKWPKVLLIVLSLFNGMLIAAGGTISFFLLEVPSLSRLIYATVMCNIAFLCLVGPPMIIAFGGIFIYCLIKGEKLFSFKENEEIEN